MNIRVFDKRNYFKQLSEIEKFRTSSARVNPLYPHINDIQVSFACM